MGRKRTAQRDLDSWKSTWDPEERELLDIFETATVAPPIWACTETMRAMGIEGSVEDLLQYMGLGVLHRFECPAFVEPTIHFFSSLRLTKARGNLVQRIELHFRIREREYSMRLSDVRAALGLPEGDREKYRPLAKPNEFWRKIADGPWNSADARNFNIRNPAIRYTARLLANTFFARRDQRKVKIDELALLHRGLREQLGSSEHHWGTTDNAAVFMFNLLRMRTRLRKTKGNVLNFGGMLTPLFVHLEIDLDCFTRVGDLRQMDMPYLVHARFVQGIDTPDGSVIYNFLRDGRMWSCRLPMPARNDVSEVDDLIFLPAGDLCFETPDLTAARGRHHTKTRSEEDTPMDDSSPDSRHADSADEGAPPYSQIRLPSPSPRATPKRKKWYQFHKITGKAIKDLYSKWTEISNGMRDLKLEVSQLRDEMRCMNLRQESQVHRPDQPAEQQPPRASTGAIPERQPARISTSEGTRPTARRRRQPARHSTSGEDLRETQKRRKGKEKVTETSTQEQGAYDESIDPRILRFFKDSPETRYFGGSSGQP